ncbi:tRNA lysidine(34) synthetase TilS [Uliginosibacterium sp. H3]|uniref:tRNA(Ile)-lysidine synthase n=1 Tax=Uliginosibacterium silvisoli TaxID=3114758 RepID=A0ABU6K3I9_9RHOO|nr:tRNA lysidine(34) synthetase TilS [Uliginosibacterium sp. H3]
MALSGGLDSSVLLHLLAQLAPSLRFQLSAVHVHHGLSPNADAWAMHCERFAQSLNIPISIHRVSVERQSADGLEAAARRARHAVFAATDCDWIVLAHHRGDQAETLLHRLMRGTGVQGMAGMRECDPARRIVRPLLDVPRSGLETHASAHRLEWIEDESNRDTHFTRNFLRREVLPLWSEKQQGLEANLARAAVLFAEAADLLEALAHEDALRIAPGTAGARQRLADLDEARARNLLRHLLALAGERAPDASWLQEALRQLLTAKDGARPVLGSTALCAWREGFWLEHEVALPQAIAWRGELHLPWAGGELCFTPGVGEGALRISANALVWIKPRVGGEQIRPDASRPSRSIKQLAQEADVPPWQRDVLPCLWCDDRLIWIGGLGADTSARCRPDEEGWRIEWRVSA